MLTPGASGAASRLTANFVKSGAGADAAGASCYYEHELPASHVRQTAPKQRSTVACHMPPAAQAWQLRDTQWCLREAQSIGSSRHARALARFGDQVLVKLRIVQGLLGFAQQLGASRLEVACRRMHCTPILTRGEFT